MASNFHIVFLHWLPAHTSVVSVRGQDRQVYCHGSVGNPPDSNVFSNALQLHISHGFYLNAMDDGPGSIALLYCLFLFRIYSVISLVLFPATALFRRTIAIVVECSYLCQHLPHLCEPGC